MISYISFQTYSFITLCILLFLITQTVFMLWLGRNTTEFIAKLYLISSLLGFVVFAAVSIIFLLGITYEL